jgi:kumamolisin
VLTVGGTTLTVTSAGAYTKEKGWSGSGGGYVPHTSEPAYQSSVSISDPYGELAKPDVAAVADPATGVEVYQYNYGWVVVGGTSVACPLWAGFLADVNSWRAALGSTGLGPVNAYLYGTVYASSTLYASTFHDPKTGNNGWAAGVGWDAVTGMGSMKGAALGKQLATDPSA